MSEEMDAKVREALACAADESCGCVPGEKCFFEYLGVLANALTSALAKNAEYEDRFSANAMAVLANKMSEAEVRAKKAEAELAVFKDSDNWGAPDDGWIVWEGPKESVPATIRQAQEENAAHHPYRGTPQPEYDLIVSKKAAERALASSQLEVRKLRDELDALDASEKKWKDMANELLGVKSILEADVARLREITENCCGHCQCNPPCKTIKTIKCITCDAIISTASGGRCYPCRAGG